MMENQTENYTLEDQLSCVENPPVMVGLPIKTHDLWLFYLLKLGLPVENGDGFNLQVPKNHRAYPSTVNHTRL